MSVKLSAQGQWKEIFRQQQLANAKRWLLHLQEADDLSALIGEEYDNLLRALEVSLKSAKTFDLSFALIQTVFPVAVGFADWDRWQEYLEIAIGQASKLDCNKEKGTLLYRLAGLLYHQGLFSNAYEKYKEAGEIFHLLEDDASYARMLAMQAILQDMQGNSVDGIEICKVALRIAEDIADEETIAHVALNLSHIYYRADQIREGIHEAEKAYDVYRKHNNLELATKSLLNLIALWAEIDDWQKINSNTEDLMEILEEKGDVLSLSQLKNNLGIVAYSQENYLVAEAMWQGALTHLLQIREPTELANIYNNLGMVYTDLDEGEAAEMMFLKGLKLYNQLGDTYKEANLQDNLAMFYISDGRIDDARVTLLSAISKIENWPESPANALELLEEMRGRLAELEHPT